VASGVGTDPDFRAVVGSYEAPFLDSERLRWRVYGSWSEFTAAELGEEDDAFLGETGVVGASLEYNIAQFGDLFVDLTAGLRLEDIETENRPAFVSGSERLLIPSVGVRLEKFTLIDELTASLRLEAADASWTGADELGLTFLGRSDPSDAWAILAWDADYSFYLEPMIDRQGWEDPNSPETSTLAHEVALALRGQWSLDHRLIPQQRGVVGGLYSVRGYPESVAAGDSMFAASAEYRFHLPRVLGIEPDPNATPIFGRPFRVAPQQVYGAPDWDLVLKAFADTARTWQADARPFESDEILFSAGVGLELALKNNLTARLDYALPATSVITGDGDEHGPGDNRVHFSVTASY
jgi:hemolysin activation/secretion protein